MGEKLKVLEKGLIQSHFLMLIVTCGSLNWYVSGKPGGQLTLSYGKE
jgi:hypothetical protein